MADLDPLSVPQANPASVPRGEIIGPDGKKTLVYATQFALDWELAAQSWFVNTAVDLQTKITTVEQTAEDAAAAVVTEATARATADSALASSITTVDAKVGNISASGAVYLAAKAAPSGASAAYGWYITAGSAFAGMEAIALSGGGSAIGFAANQFYFTDSGTAQQVLSYSGGVFIFQVPIVIRNASTGERQEITSSNTKIYDSGGNLRVAIGVGI